MYPCCTWAGTLGPPAKHAGTHPGRRINPNSELWERLLKPAEGWGSGTAAGHQLPSRNVRCWLKGTGLRNWDSMLLHSSRHTLSDLNIPTYCCFAKVLETHSSNSSSFVAKQILFRLLGLLCLCWKVTLQSAVSVPIEDQRCALNYTIEFFSAKDDRTGIWYSQQ